MTFLANIVWVIAILMEFWGPRHKNNLIIAYMKIFHDCQKTYIFVKWYQINCLLGGDYKAFFF